MTKTIKLALVAAMAMGTTSAFATNGDNLIGTGAQSRAMGGVGIAKSFGAQSSLANPALLSSVEKMEVSGSATFFMPDVEYTAFGAPAATSDADFSVIPEIAFAHRISDNMVYGISITGTAGMGVDYSDQTFGGATDNGSFEMKTELQLLKVAVPFSYEVSGLSLGVAPVLQYGTLELSHQFDTSGVGSGPFALLDNGSSSDTSFGYELGLAYDFKDAGVEGLTVGAVYKSELGMTYDNTIASSVAVFGGAALTGIASGDDLDQPAEIGLGVAYAFGASTIAFDYKNVGWGDAAGYSDFGWENQDIYAIGYEYAATSWAVRVGYNYAESPIAEQALDAADGGYSGSVKNFFNLAGFPAIVESHFTVGGSYTVMDNLDLDAAVVYAPEVEENFDVSALQGQAPGTFSATTTHSQLGVTIGATYKF